MPIQEIENADITNVAKTVKEFLWVSVLLVSDSTEWMVRENKLMMDEWSWNNFNFFKGLCEPWSNVSCLASMAVWRDGTAINLISFGIYGIRNRCRDHTGKQNKSKELEIF